MAWNIRKRKLSGDRIRILVVDDSITTRTLEQSILEANGYDVRVAVGDFGERALDAARRRRCAVHSAYCQVFQNGVVSTGVAERCLRSLL